MLEHRRVYVGGASPGRSTWPDPRHPDARLTSSSGPSRFGREEIPRRTSSQGSSSGWRGVPRLVHPPTPAPAGGMPPRRARVGVPPTVRRGFMPPAKSAVPWARSIRRHGTAGSAGGARPHPPCKFGGGAGCAGKWKAASALRFVKVGVKGRRKAASPRGPASCRPRPKCPGHRAREMQMQACRARARARPGRRRAASLGGRHARPSPRPASCPQARPPSWRPHGPPAARRSAAAGPRRHRRTMPRPCGLSVSFSHMWFSGSAPAFFSRKTAILPNIGVPSAWCILVQWRSVRAGSSGREKQWPRECWYTRGAGSASYLGAREQWPL